MRYSGRCQPITKPKPHQPPESLTLRCVGLRQMLRADLGRSSHEGHLCGPGAVELPGCLSGDGCPGNATWGSEYTNGRGPVRNVLIQNVRLSDAVKRAGLKISATSTPLCPNENKFQARLSS